MLRQFFETAPHIRFAKSESSAGSAGLQLVCQVVKRGQRAEKMDGLTGFVDVNLQFALVRADLHVLPAVDDFDKSASGNFFSSFTIACAIGRSSRACMAASRR